MWWGEVQVMDGWRAGWLTGRRDDDHNTSESGPIWETVQQKEVGEDIKLSDPLFRIAHRICETTYRNPIRILVLDPLRLGLSFICARFISTPPHGVVRGGHSPNGCSSLNFDRTIVDVEDAGRRGKKGEREVVV